MNVAWDSSQIKILLNLDDTSSTSVGGSIIIRIVWLYKDLNYFIFLLYFSLFPFIFLLPFSLFFSFSSFSSLYYSVSGAVHTGVEVCRMYSEMSGLVEQPWLQLICCTVCLLCGCNFRWRRESPSGSEYWLVCCRWTPEIEFNESLSLPIIRLVNYSVTTSLIYKLIV